jgi:hypothetical protein
MSDEGTGGAGGGEWVRLRWDAPEVAVVAVLAATATLIIAGVVSGIVIGTSTAQPGTGSVVALAAQYATEQWAGVFTAFLMLGALGVCWWQHGVWRDQGGADEAQLCEAAARRERARRLALLALAGLLLATLGSIASLVGRLDSLQSFGAQTTAAVWVPGIAEILGTVAMTIAGLLIGGRLMAPRDLPGVVPDVIPDDLDRG